MSRDPLGSPSAIMALLERFLPFAVSVFTERRELFDLPGYEPGLRESNLATILAHVAASSDYPKQAPGSALERNRLVDLAGEALGRVAPHPWDSVPPLAWSYISYALVLLGDRLEPSIRDALREGVRRWADRLLDYDFPTGLYRDTKAEETCWTAGPLVGALALWPDSHHRDAWQEKAHCFYLNAYNREEDLWDDTVVAGRSVRERVCTANVFPDFSTENHSAFHPIYQTCINNYSIPYILSRTVLGGVPDTLVWNWAGLHSVMRRLFTADGQIAYPGGNDYYPSSHCEQVHYLALVADALKDPLALWALKKALASVDRFQRANHGRLVGELVNGEAHMYWELHFASFLVFAHALAPFEGIRVIDDREALQYGSGPWVSPYAGILVHKGSKLHTCASLRAVARRRPGSGFIVPQGAVRWTDYFCAQPQLVPVIRDHEGQEIQLHIEQQLLGTSDTEAWSVAAFCDGERSIRRTTCLLAHEEGVLHVERVMRYGEQVPIFGSDMDLSRVRAAEPEYGPWSVRTLHYRTTNDDLEFHRLTVRDEQGEQELCGEPRTWESRGAWLLINDRLALIRLWGTGPWILEYSEETEPLHPRHYWQHHTWALSISLPGATPPPRGYGLMGGHAVLFVPAGDPEAPKTIVRDARASVEEEHGVFAFRSSLEGWETTHRMGLGHLLRFE